MIEKIRKEWNPLVGVPENDKPTIIHRDKSILMVKLLLEEVYELKDAIQDPNLNDEERIIAIADAHGDIDYLLKGSLNQHGLHKVHNDVMLEIHRSNMTKIVDGKLIKREDGKVLKPDTYSKPDLSFILKN